jgi:hypothetical protein
MVEDPKKSKPRTITGLTHEEWLRDRARWLSGSSEWANTQMLRHIAEANLKAAKLQLEAAAKRQEDDPAGPGPAPAPSEPAKGPDKVEEARQLIREIIPGGAASLSTEAVRQMLCFEREKTRSDEKDYFKWDTTNRALDRDRRKPRK